MFQTLFFFFVVSNMHVKMIGNIELIKKLLL
jgi:hypothetical protein